MAKGPASSHSQVMMQVHVTQRRCLRKSCRTFPALLGRGLPAGSIKSLRHSSGATANVCGPRTCERRHRAQPGAWSLEPGARGPQEHPFPSSAPPPAPPNTLGLTPKPSSHSLLLSPTASAPQTPTQSVCTLRCMHAHSVKARPLTDTAHLPSPGGGAAITVPHGKVARTGREATQPHGVPAAALHGLVSGSAHAVGVQ